MKASLLIRIWNYLRIKSAVKSAEKMHKLTKKQYYVIKVFNKIRVYDRAHINFMISQGVLSQRLKDAIQLKKIAIYYTK